MPDQPISPESFQALRTARHADPAGIATALGGRTRRPSAGSVRGRGMR